MLRDLILELSDFQSHYGDPPLQKYALFFLSTAPTHHSFTFNSQFLYELKYMVHLSKTVHGIFHFRFCFVQQKASTL